MDLFKIKEAIIKGILKVKTQLTTIKFANIQLKLEGKRYLER